MANAPPAGWTNLGATDTSSAPTGWTALPAPKTAPPNYGGSLYDALTSGGTLMGYAARQAGFGTPDEPGKPAKGTEAQRVLSSPITIGAKSALLDLPLGAAQLAAHATGVMPKQADQLVNYFNKPIDDAAAATGNSTLGPSLVGAVVSPWNLLGGELLRAPQGAGLLARGLRAAATGGAFGALSPNAGGDDFWTQKGLQTALGTGLGAAGHAVFGEALPAASDLIGRAARWTGLPQVASTMSRAAGTLTNFPAAAERRVGALLNEAKSAAPGTLPTFTKAPLPGQDLTLGPATSDPGLISLDRDVRNTSEYGNQLDTRSMDARTNTAIRTGMNQLGNASGSNGSENMGAALIRVRDAAKARVDALWKSIGIDDATNIPTAPLKQSMQDWLNSLPMSDRSVVQKTIGEYLGHINDDYDVQEPLRQLQSTRKRISQAASEAFNSGDQDLGRLLRQGRDIIGKFADDPPDAGAGSALNTDPNLISRYQQARAATAQFHRTFSDDPTISGILDGTIKPSLVADKIFQPGQPENLQTLLNALGSDQAARQTVRDAFMQKMLNETRASGEDVLAQKNFSPSQIGNFVDPYNGHGHVITSGLFTPEQQALFGKINQAAQLPTRINLKSTAGTDTAAKLAGQNYIKTVLGTAPPTMTSALLGAGIGGLAGLTFGPRFGVNPYEAAAFGAAAGGGGGGLARNRLLQPFLEQSGREARDLLAQAVGNPDLARQLMLQDILRSALTKAPARGRRLPIPNAAAFGSLAGAAVPFAQQPPQPQQ